ncbi:glycine cleavage system aminomethyltransferase GcvT [Gloeothece verrucosa]|uniref:Aminomethyltransferase n=1 Tax=Gloeothece verrucosa (strain PCC 7822) TaxID=497965 RepID=E0UJZ7_GLOV7|nr:glycine cleavage system aminomethyltransferase GcvT [Gloeothece verrucosa]ADN14633.1 glycine cleavage system T protein [Gloeothece verrucosa PCC 7822]
MANPDPSSQPLLRTPLYTLTLEQKAKLTAFAGWEMPVQFSGLKQEHQAVRTQAGMFDISHMGKFIFKGQDIIKQLQELVPSNLSRIQAGQAQYTVLLNPQGGIIDDIIVYYQGEKNGQQEVTLIVNAATTEKDKTWILEHISQSVEFADLSQEKALIAVQGPQAESFLQSFVKEDLSGVKLFEHLKATLLDQPGFIARTGYTGEDGFEIMVDPEIAQQLWRKLSDAGVTPCGLGARDTLRLEAALALYGQDIDDTTTPLEAGLGWLVHLKTLKEDFIGRSVLEKQKAQGVSRRLVGVEMEGRYIARHGYPVISNSKIVGEVTSGTLSPTLGIPVALAYVPTELSEVGQKLEIEIRGKTYPGKVVKKPFYRSPNKAS